ncbi:MAG: carbohydrate binding family 9 domain-containing protein [Vicinamibacteria bacterium]|nr:carbohydrate binding family 9 domain-containing protein [Vicinamibacteria bacterium]
MLLLPLLAALLVADAETRPTLRVGPIKGTMEIDGRLSEIDWLNAAAISDLTMIEPIAGGPPTGRTEIKVLANEREIVIGVRCFDPDPSKIVSFTKERDGNFDSEDHLLFVLDPFQDGRSGYVFSVNPGGARGDGLVVSNGESVDKSWDGVWEAATERDSEGWSAEIRIPVFSINFAKRLAAWGLNVQRRIQRNQETERWAAASRDTKVYQTARSGLLTDLPDFSLGHGVSFRPAVVGGFDHPSRDSSTSATGDLSLDMAKRLGPNLTASVTINTDFAETEVDTRQTNLTRFPLFFPEKRAFFLEGSDTFVFGLGLSSDIRPFFSRRIGLVDGNEVPILAGAKLSGRQGKTSIGALVVRTRQASGVAPATSLAALRVRRNVLNESSVGFIATAGDPLGRPGASTFGVDLTYQNSRFRGGKNFWLGAWGLMARRDGLAGSREAWGVKLDMPNDLWDIAASYRYVGDGFDPSLGFVPRPAVKAYRLSITYAPRLPGTFIRQMFNEFIVDYFTNLRNERESYRVFMAPINWRLESGDRVEANFAPAGERLSAPFEIAPGVVIPVGTYDWKRYRLEAGTAAKRRLAAQVTWWFGSFYNGKLDQINVDGSWTPSPVVSLLFNVQHNAGRLPAGDFDQTLIGVKVRLNLSPDLQLNSFVQFDNETQTVGTNTRLRWTFHPQGDLFVIYNHNLRDFKESPSGWARDSNALMVKAQYAWRR